MRTLLAGLAVGALAVAPSFAQSVISAHSGVIHYTEGKILVDDKDLQAKPSEFADVKTNSVLRTEEGRAEILLTPGVFLRIGEQSSVKMLSNNLSDTRVEVLTGEALVESDEILKDNAVTVVYKNTTVALAKRGLYDFDASLGRLRVYDGEVVVKNPSGQLTAKKGQEVNLNGGPLMASKFDVKVGDPLIRWASRRSGYISMANVAAARSASGYSSGYYNSGWAYNPWFGMYTFIPGAGITYGPFGNPFWSPYASFWYAPYYPGYYGGYYGGGYYGGGYYGGGVVVSSGDREYHHGYGYSNGYYDRENDHINRNVNVNRNVQVNRNLNVNRNVHSNPNVHPGRNLNANRNVSANRNVHVNRNVHANRNGDVRHQ